jgi:DNA-binding protein
MADVVEKKIEGKLRLLKFNNEQTTKIVESADLKAIERHVSVLESIIEKVHELKLEVQEIKFESGEEIGKVRLWIDLPQVGLERNASSERERRSRSREADLSYLQRAKFY